MYFRFKLKDITVTVFERVFTALPISDLKLYTLMEPSYLTSCFLILFAAVIFQTSMIKGNHQISICENANNTNIACTKESVIVINDTWAKPFENKTLGHVWRDACLFDALNSSRSHIERTCKSKHNCTIDNTLINMTSCGSIERMLNITFRCEYEYVGCFVDNPKRVLSKQESSNSMSAKICYDLCLPHQQSYFGTENSDECFCGDDKRLGIRQYRQVKNTECKKTCKKHSNEVCGGNWRISVYKTNTATQQLNSVTVTDIKSKRCNFSAALKDIDQTSFETSGDCDTNRSNNQVSADDFNIQEIAMGRSDNYDLQFLPNFVTVNFSCVFAKNNMYDRSHAEEDTWDGARTIGAVVGSVFGTGLAFAVVVSIYLCKRCRQTKATNANKKDSSSGQEKQTGVFGHTCPEKGSDASVKHIDFQNEDHTYSTANIDDQVYQNDSHFDIYEKATLPDNYEYHASDKLDDNNGEIVFSNKTRVVSQQHGKRSSSSSDQYVDHIEGVYDETNKRNYKTDNHGQGIYSNVVDDVYDKTTFLQRSVEGDAYDHFYGGPVGSF